MLAVPGPSRRDQTVELRLVLAPLPLEGAVDAAHVLQNISYDTPRLMPAGLDVNAVRAPVQNLKP
jgi:hypothetical protein